MGLGEERELICKLDLQSSSYITGSSISLPFRGILQIGHFEEASAMNTTWHTDTETGRLACTWSELPRSVPYNPDWMQGRITTGAEPAAPCFLVTVQVVRAVSGVEKVRQLDGGGNVRHP